MSKEAKRLINRLYGDDKSASAKVNQVGSRKFIANIRVDVTQIERPASVDLYISGKKIGGMVVMAQPSKGFVHGAIPLDDALEAAGIRRSDVDRVVDSIQSSITVTITKVCALILNRFHVRMLTALSSGTGSQYH